VILPEHDENTNVVYDEEGEPIPSQTVPDACPDKQAAYELVSLMRRMSEDYWAAGWLMGLEHDLWKMSFEGSNQAFGLGVDGIAIEERAKLIELCVRCQGWWLWDEVHGGERFATLDEWLPRYQDDVDD